MNWPEPVGHDKVCVAKTCAFWPVFLSGIWNEFTVSSLANVLIFGMVLKIFSRRSRDVFIFGFFFVAGNIFARMFAASGVWMEMRAAYAWLPYLPAVNIGIGIILSVYGIYVLRAGQRRRMVKTEKICSIPRETVARFKKTGLIGGAIGTFLFLAAGILTGLIISGYPEDPDFIISFYSEISGMNFADGLKILVFYVLGNSGLLFAVWVGMLFGMSGRWGKACQNEGGYVWVVVSAIYCAVGLGQIFYFGIR